MWHKLLQNIKKIAKMKATTKNFLFFCKFQVKSKKILVGAEKGRQNFFVYASTLSEVLEFQVQANNNIIFGAEKGQAEFFSCAPALPLELFLIPRTSQ